MMCYRGTSIQTGPKVEETELLASQIPETGQWFAEIQYGSTMSAFDSEADALAAGRKSLEYDGWVTSYEDAERTAAEIWKRRNSESATRLRRLFAKNRNTLHIDLGLPRGQASLSQVWKWACGEDEIPSAIDQKVREILAQ